MLKDREYYDRLTHTLLREQPFLNQTDLAYELVLREILNGQLSPGESSHFSFSLRRVKPCECRISAICATA